MKSKWNKITIEDVRLTLAEDEIDRLNTLSTTEENLNKIIDQTIEMVSSMIRGSLQSKGYTLDFREYYLPKEYYFFALIIIRYQLWTRFPNSNKFALDDARTKQYEEAMSMIKNPILGPSTPDYSDLPDEEKPKPIEDVALINPKLKFDAFYGWKNILNKTE